MLGLLHVSPLEKTVDLASGFPRVHAFSPDHIQSRIEREIRRHNSQLTKTHGTQTLSLTSIKPSIFTTALGSLRPSICFPESLQRRCGDCQPLSNILRRRHLLGLLFSFSRRLCYRLGLCIRADFCFLCRSRFFLRMLPRLIFGVNSCFLVRSCANFRHGGDLGFFRSAGSGCGMKFPHLFRPHLRNTTDSSRFCGSRLLGDSRQSCCFFFLCYSDSRRLAPSFRLPVFIHSH